MILIENKNHSVDNQDNISENKIDCIIIEKPLHVSHIKVIIYKSRDDNPTTI